MKFRFLFLVFTLFYFSCQTPQKVEPTLGHLDFQVRGKAEAMPHFEEGLLFLHSFEYTDARYAFQKAKELDNEFVMAYWGEAMTHNHSIWGNQDLEEGRAILALLDEKVAGISVEMEADFVAAVQVLYEKEEKNERDELYRQKMKNLWRNILIIWK